MIAPRNSLVGCAAHCFYCEQPAELEKIGRCVCRRHAGYLQGREYPLRSGRWRGPSLLQTMVDLDMIEKRYREP